MKKKKPIFYFIIAVVLCLIVAISWRSEKVLQAPALANFSLPDTAISDRPIAPIPNNLQLNAAKVALG
jgi:hypothetical protein